MQNVRGPWSLVDQCPQINWWGCGVHRSRRIGYDRTATFGSQSLKSAIWGQIYIISGESTNKTYPAFWVPFPQKSSVLPCLILHQIFIICLFVPWNFLYLFNETVKIHISWAQVRHEAKRPIGVKRVFWAGPERVKFGFGLTSNWTRLNSAQL